MSVTPIPPECQIVPDADGLLIVAALWPEQRMTAQLWDIFLRCNRLHVHAFALNGEPPSAFDPGLIEYAVTNADVQALKTLPLTDVEHGTANVEVRRFTKQVALIVACPERAFAPWHEYSQRLGRADCEHLKFCSGQEFQPRTMH